MKCLHTPAYARKAYSRAYLLAHANKHYAYSYKLMYSFSQENLLRL